MTIETLTTFFMWCSIINGGLLLYAVVIQMVAPDFIYTFQRRFFPINRETYETVYYAFLGGYKLLYLVFNLVPYIALRIME
ncbi:DUF6868 family protein [Pseudodesulfovibrio sediminis]|uniref:DUF6868 domain-containing protein n=1 Tax=Pseudodesulfovibrio sediminis TaxID=2810563 RepID=A0ABM7P4M6_9BACT|nr:hypothetical protein [Pseudodesulfovibrio sediminis]BCS87855.1 hypothetical protein PSDVSF_10970 [Pseudodesulfovibrio sediminis]